MNKVREDIKMELNEVVSSIMARRSIRKYLDKPVEHEKQTRDESKVKFIK